LYLKRRVGAMGEGQQGRKLTAKQELFIVWYVRLLNAYRAAERAGYSGDQHTLEQVGHENLNKPEIRAEIDRRLKASIPSADEVLTRISQRAHVDVTPYLDSEQRIDVQALASAGLGHLVVGVKPGRQGPEITLASPETASKMLARYHRVLGADTQVDITATLEASEDALAALTGQIQAAAQQPAIEPDQTDDAE
jgi:hypothetical protein